VLTPGFANYPGGKRGTADKLHLLQWVAPGSLWASTNLQEAASPAIFQNGPTYSTLLATLENILFAFPPIKRIVPMTMMRITASMTAYSAMSWPSSLD